MKRVHQALSSGILLSSVRWLIFIEYNADFNMDTLQYDQMILPIDPSGTKFSPAKSQISF